MRWAAKEGGWRKRFAWLPVKIGDEWIWWEPCESWFMGEFSLVRLPEDAQAMSAGTAKTEGLGGDSPASAVRQDAPQGDHP